MARSALTISDNNNWGSHVSLTAPVMGVLDGRSILVVEDEMLVMMNLEVALEDMGCSSVCPVATVMKALAMLNEQNFDLAILDVNLGGEKSYPIADILILLAIIPIKLAAQLPRTNLQSTDQRPNRRHLQFW